MRLYIGIVFCCLVMGVSSEGWYSFIKEAIQGTGDLWRAYWHMREANNKSSERYFHARGNHEAAQRGPGGVWAAKTISNAKNYVHELLNWYFYGNSKHESEDIESNRLAEEWGRSGNDPNHFRPPGLPEKF